MRVWSKMRNKVAAVRKKIRCPRRYHTRPLWFWRHCPKQMWSMARDPDIKDDPLTTLRDHFLTQLQFNCIAKTQKGSITNVPRTSQVGDLIVILYGWKTPFILRPMCEGYLLIGDCYVYGIMHGKAIDQDMGDEKDFKLV